MGILVLSNISNKASLILDSDRTQIHFGLITLKSVKQRRLSDLFNPTNLLSVDWL